MTNKYLSFVPFTMHLAGTKLLLSLLTLSCWTGTDDAHTWEKIRQKKLTAVSPHLSLNAND